MRVGRIPETGWIFIGETDNEPGGKVDIECPFHVILAVPNEALKVSNPNQCDNRMKPYLAR